MYRLVMELGLVRGLVRELVQEQERHLEDQVDLCRKFKKSHNEMNHNRKWFREVRNVYLVVLSAKKSIQKGQLFSNQRIAAPILIETFQVQHRRSIHLLAAVHWPGNNQFEMAMSTLLDSTKDNTMTDQWDHNKAEL